MPATLASPKDRDAARAECITYLGDELCFRALECFRLVGGRKGWQADGAQWAELLESLKKAEPRLRELGSIAAQPSLSTRHPEFVDQLKHWINEGRKLRARAEHLEPQATPARILEGETGQIAEWLTVLEMQAPRSRRKAEHQGRGRPRLHLIVDRIAALLDVASGRTPVPAHEEHWAAMIEQWRKALVRARTRMKDPLTREMMAEKIARETEFRKVRLPARSPALADLIAQHGKTSEDELLYAAVEGEPEDRD